MKSYVKRPLSAVRVQEASRCLSPQLIYANIQNAINNNHHHGKPFGFSVMMIIYLFPNFKGVNNLC